jgi:hypothetical protein
MKSAMKKVLFMSMLASLLFSVHASAKDVVANAYCPMTGAQGVGHGPTYDAALGNAIKACIANGGKTGCCQKFTRKVS